MAEEITPSQLVEKLLQGAKEFGGTRMASGSNLAAERDFVQLVAYLSGQDLRASPVLAEEADWAGLQAPGLFLQGTKWARANLKGADLSGADLRRSDMSGVNLSGANLSGATLVGCRMMGADLSGADLRGTDFYEASLAGANLRGADASGALLLRLALKEADLTGVNLMGANMYRCDLRAAVGLAEAKNLATCHFHQTAVTDKELAIITAAMKKSVLFEVRAE